MVDTVLYLEGERFANARILRTYKNRFGAVEEVGIFEMDEKGLKEIDNPTILGKKIQSTESAREERIKALLDKLEKLTPQ